MAIAFLPLQASGNLPTFYLMFEPGAALGSAYSPISPLLLQTSQNMLGETINQGLSSINAQGSNMFSTIANLFASWSATQNQFEQSVAANFTNVTNKSAKACNGFFGCLFT